MVQLLCAASEVALYVVLAFACVHLVRLALWARAAPVQEVPRATSPTSVTVQLPLRNEPLMAEALLRSVAQLRGDALDLQVLDDSDDETSAILERVVTELRTADHDIALLRRSDRRGYKAGNLAHGLRHARGEYILVLDADFRPGPDLALQLAHVLDQNPTLAFAQARWTFRNTSTTLTRLQASILDALFCVEQAALSAARAPVQFNGSAGMWRRSAIDRAGGWDTSEASLTEDLELSFRAHEAGLRGTTLAALAASTELPEAMGVFRTQQARWVRGAALTVRTLGTRAMKSASARDALAMAAHLARHARQPLFVAAILRLPLVALGCCTPVTPAWLGPVVIGAAIVSATLYLAAGARRAGRHVRPLEGLRLALLSVGLAPSLAIAFVGGLAGRRGAGFVRTQKGHDQRSSIHVPTAVLCGLSCLALAGFARALDLVGIAAALLCAVGTAWVAF